MTDTKSVDVGRTVAQPKIWIYAVRFYNHQNAVTVYDVDLISTSWSVSTYFSVYRKVRSGLLHSLLICCNWLAKSTDIKSLLLNKWG